MGFLSAIASVFNGAADRAHNWNMQQYQNRYNSREAQKNRDFQSDEAEKSRQFTIDQWNRTNEYNSPENQMRLKLDAGMNPWNNPSSGEASSAPSPTSAPSGSTASSVTPPYVQTSENFGINAFSAITKGIKDISDSALTNAEKNRINTLLGDELKNLRSETSYKNVLTTYQEVINKYADKRNLIELSKIGQEINKLQSESNLNEKKISEVSARVTSLLEKANVDAATAAQMTIFIQNYARDLYKAQINALNTGSSKNLADAKLSNHQSNLADAQTEKVKAETETEDQMRSSRVEHSENNMGPSDSYQAAYALASDLSRGDKRLSRAVAAILAGWREVRDSSKDAAEIFSMIKSIGVKIDSNDRSKIADFLKSRKVSP